MNTPGLSVPMGPSNLVTSLASSRTTWLPAAVMSTVRATTHTSGGGGEYSWDRRSSWTKYRWSATVRDSYLGPKWLIGCSPPEWSSDYIGSWPSKKERKGGGLVSFPSRTANAEKNRFEMCIGIEIGIKVKKKKSLVWTKMRLEMGIRIEIRMISQNSNFFSNGPFEKRPVMIIEDTDFYFHDHCGSHIYIHIYICIFIYIHIHIYTNIYIYIYINIYINIHIYLYMYIYIHTHVCMYIYICIYTYIYVCMYIYTYTITNNFVYIHICIYIYTHIHMRVGGCCGNVTVSPLALARHRCPKHNLSLCPHRLSRHCSCHFLVCAQCSICTGKRCLSFVSFSWLWLFAVFSRRAHAGAYADAYM